MQIDGFDIFAFVVMGVLVAAVVLAIVALGSLPGKIAAARHHPHADAVNAASWISLVTLGALTAPSAPTAPTAARPSTAVRSALRATMRAVRVVDMRLLDSVRDLHSQT